MHNLAKISFVEVDFEQTLFGSFDLVNLIQKESDRGEPGNPNRSHRRVVVTSRLIKDAEALVNRFNATDFGRAANHVKASNYKEMIEDFIDWDYTVAVGNPVLFESYRFPFTGSIIYLCRGSVHVDIVTISQLAGRFRGEDSRVVVLVKNARSVAYKHMQNHFQTLGLL